MISLVRFGILDYICTRSVSYAQMERIKEAKMLGKIIKKSVVKKKVVNTQPRKLKREVLESAYDNEAANRKIASLNKLYMEQLIELISCGQFAKRLAELGIEFSKVKLTPCRSSINMYWISNRPGLSQEPEVMEVLTNLKKELQGQIGFVKYMRKIPFISFVKDLRLERENNIESILKVADYGKDVQPTNPRRVVKSDSTELMKMNVGENIQMRQNVLGLDHAKTTEKIMQNIKRFQAINIEKTDIVEEQYEYPGKLVVFSKKLFDSFYRRKIYLDRKLRKREYVDSYIALDEPYDPGQEADKYWQLHKCEDHILEEKEHELPDYANLYGDHTWEEDDKEDIVDDSEENDNSGKELGNEEKSSELFTGAKTKEK